MSTDSPAASSTSATAFSNDAAAPSAELIGERVLRSGHHGDRGGDLDGHGVEVAPGDRGRGVSGEGLGDRVAADAGDDGDGRVAQDMRRLRCPCRGEQAVVATRGDGPAVVAAKKAVARCAGASFSVVARQGVDTAWG
jgi:hypothetical protein